MLELKNSSKNVVLSLAMDFLPIFSVFEHLLSRRDEDREHFLALPQSAALLPLTVTTVMGFLDLRRVPSSPELRFFVLSMCTDAPESMTNSRSPGFVEECRQYPGFGKTAERNFLLLLGVKRHPWSFLRAHPSWFRLTYFPQNVGAFGVRF